MDTSLKPRLPFWAAITCFAAIVTYWQSFNLPLISDDYVVIWLSRSYGEPGGMTALFSDALYRCRATYMILTLWIDRVFGLSQTPYNVIGILFHVLNCLLVLALGFWNKIGFRIAIPAAIYFAVQHGHQEAVMWYSALPDQMAMTCCMACVFATKKWVESRRAVWYAIALAIYLIALFTKESGIVAGGLFALVLLVEGRSLRSIIIATAPFAIIGAIYFYAGFAARSDHLHYNDGTFSLGFHFVPVILRSIFRMLWVWGLVALAAVFLWQRQLLRIAGISFAWMAITLVPYGFLKYMPHVPSRHTYIASVGLALIVGAGFVALYDRWKPGTAAVVLIALAVAGSEWGFLWTKKYHQFLERAQSTEHFAASLKKKPTKVIVRCFPFGPSPIDALIKLRYGPGTEVIEEKVPASTPGCEPNGIVEVIYD